jgi:hypothetical protein
MGKRGLPPSVACVNARACSPRTSRTATRPELLARAIRLPQEARAALADSLLESLDRDVDDGAEEAWREEIQCRLRESDSGAVNLIPWQDARKRLGALLKR